MNMSRWFTKGGVYFVEAQTVNACVRADGYTEKTDAYELMDSRKTMRTS